MNMLAPLRLLAVFAILPGCFALAQSAGSNANKAASNSANADQAWADLTALARVPASSRIRGSSDKGSDETKARAKQQAEQQGQVSQAAKAFYTQYPSHPKAGEARKLEALGAIRGLASGDAAGERAALATAAALRNDKTAPASDRCEVALAVARYQLSQQFKSRAVKDTLAERRKLAENLQKEFGDLPALQVYHLELARGADFTAAGELAALVARSAAATDKMKTEAQAILDRGSLVGKALPVKLTKLDGGELDLTQPSDKLVALIVWSPANFASLGDLGAIAHNVRPDAEVVYMGLGGTRAQLLAARPALPLPGAFCYAATPAAARAFGAAVKLPYAPVPCVYVLNRGGKVAGYGRLDELPSLLAKAAVK